MKKLTAEQSLRKDRLSGLFLTVLVLVVAILSVTRVVIANRLVEASDQLRILDSNLAQLQEANQTITSELRGPQSISQIEDKATALGFTKTTRLVFLGGPSEVALLR